jgi:sulfate-transporting ATPase
LATGGFPGGVIAEHFNHGIQWLVLIGGVATILILIQDPNGMASSNVKMFRRATGKLSSTLRKSPEAPVLPAETETVHRVRPSSLEVNHLTVRFGAAVALDDVSLSLSTGEVVGLIGPNGAGKTTFIDAVTGFVKPTSGEVLLAAQSIGSWAPHRRARAGVTRSFQSLELFDDISVIDNIRAACDDGRDRAYLASLVRSKDRALSPAAAAAIRSFRLEADLMRRPEELSYGRRRLVAIARAAATSPVFLLLDEPAAGMGDIEAEEVGELIRYLAREWGIGILLIEHDVSLVMKTCDRIAVLDFGRKLSEGTPDEIRRDPRVIEAYLGTEMGELPEVAVLGEGRVS